MNKTEAKTIVSIVLNVLGWAFLVFAALVTILTFVSTNADKNDGVPAIFGKSVVSVQSPSMDGDKEGSFKQGDMLFVDKVTQDEAWDLDEGTIIVYRAPIDINGDGETGDINTHRIVRKWTTEGGIVYFKTQGDAEAEDTYDLRYSNVIAVYNGHSRLRGMGAVADFLKSSIGFLLVVVLPMALFFLYELYNLFKILMENKMQKAAATATVSAETEEEIKRRAIEEFLAKQAEANAEKPESGEEE